MNAILVLVLVPVLARSGEMQKKIESCGILYYWPYTLITSTSFLGESADDGEGKADGRAIGRTVETAIT
jgi:hypothetical protein